MHRNIVGDAAIHRPLIDLPDISKHSAPRMCASRIGRAISGPG
jgi:hypothetical protein